MNLFKSSYKTLKSGNDRDARILISASDFPGDEKIARMLIPELYVEYRDDAQMASMTFCRGSVLMQEAEEVTKDLIERCLAA